MKKFLKWLILVFVVSIIGTVATMPNVDSHGYWLGKSKSDIRVLKATVFSFLEDHKRLPNAAEGLVSLVNTARKESGSDRKYYLDRLPRDYWGNNYIYRVVEEGKRFEVYSAGPDTVDNEGMGDDVVAGDKHYSCELYHDCLSIKDYTYRAFIITTLISMIIMILLMIFTIYKYLRHGK